MFSQAISSKQREILEFIKETLKETSQSPTISEIAVAVGMTSKGSVAEQLASLEKKGYIRRIPGAYRGIVLNEEDEGFVEIPLKGAVSAGYGLSIYEEYESIKVPRKLILSSTRPYFALKVSGHSMKEDGIYDGEIVIIESRNYADNGDLVVAKIPDNQATLKYYYKDAEGIRLEPRNKAESYVPIDLKDCEILGLFRGVATTPLD